jgi:hypothetical protein
MDRRNPSPASRLSTLASVVVSVVAFPLFIWLVVVTPAFISFEIAIVVAVAWCIWLERHSSTPSND